MCYTKEQWCSFLQDELGMESVFVKTAGIYNDATYEKNNVSVLMNFDSGFFSIQFKNILIFLIPPRLTGISLVLRIHGCTKKMKPIYAEYKSQDDVRLFLRALIMDPKLMPVVVPVAPWAAPFAELVYTGA